MMMARNWFRRCVFVLIAVTMIFMGSSTAVAAEKRGYTATDDLWQWIRKVMPGDNVTVLLSRLDGPIRTDFFGDGRR